MFALHGVRVRVGTTISALWNGIFYLSMYNVRSWSIIVLGVLVTVVYTSN